MKLSRKWLNEFTEIPVSDSEYADRMTLSGSKVEGIERPGDEIENVVAGRVIDIVRHANSDHLFVCTVEVGQDAPVTIVTGAQNVVQGAMVPVALHNSTLPGGVKIKKGNLRGVKSEGMLCSLGELGLTAADYPYAIEDGIFLMEEPCSPGDDIRTVLGLDDTIVDFEITNNRPDCLSIRGLARESAVTFGTPLRLPEPAVRGSGGNIADYLDIEIANPTLCPRYTARFVKNIKIAPSPAWMRRRLRACGVRPINNIVDITNYVMLEYGQPMHAFDYACVTGRRITVRNAAPGEQMTTLDGTPRALREDMLVIADDTRAIGLAGVMGGENSEITENTQAVVFESANFNGVSVRKTSIALGMRTDASSRFEKGLDPLGTLPAVQRACELVELLGAGEVVDGVIDVIAADSAPTVLPLEPARINRLLGTDIPRAFMVQVLTDLGFTFDGDQMTVPSWRGDVSHYSDVAEEVARFYGYDAIEPTLFNGATVEGGLTDAQKTERQLGVLCRGMGYSEILTYSFGGQTDNDKIAMPADHVHRNAAVILNPLGEDSSVMRTSMLPSLLECLGRNYSYRNRDVQLYELARVYWPVVGQALPEERKMLVLGAYGGQMDFFRLKGQVEALLRALRIDSPRFAADTEAHAYHPGRCARIFCGELCLGVFGQIHPTVADGYGIGAEVYAAELDFANLLLARSPEPLYIPLPRFPAVHRDLAVVCAKGIPVADLARCIREAGGNLLAEVEFFDVYTGAPIPEDKKSVAFSLVFRGEDKSLSDADIDPAMQTILSALAETYGATRR